MHFFRAKCIVFFNKNLQKKLYYLVNISGLNENARNIRPLNQFFEDFSEKYPNFLVVVEEISKISKKISKISKKSQKFRKIFRILKFMTFWTMQKITKILQNLEKFRNNVTKSRKSWFKKPILKKAHKLVSKTAVEILTTSLARLRVWAIRSLA